MENAQVSTRVVEGWRYRHSKKHPLCHLQTSYSTFTTARAPAVDRDEQTHGEPAYSWNLLPATAPRLCPRPRMRCSKIRLEKIGSVTLVEIQRP